MSLKKQYKVFQLSIHSSEISGYRDSLSTINSYLLEEISIPWNIDSQDIEKIKEWVENKELQDITILPVYSFSHFED